jgi:hypothetical protein
MVDGQAVRTERHNRKEQVMALTTRQSQSGFICLGLLLVLIVVLLICSALAKPANPSAADGKQPATPNDVAGDARAIAESARATTALSRLSQEGSGDYAPAAVPAIDPTATDPVSGDGLGDILEDILDGF